MNNKKLYVKDVFAITTKCILVYKKIDFDLLKTILLSFMEIIYSPQILREE